METQQKTFKFGNLTITQTKIKFKEGIFIHNDVSRFNGSYDELLGQNDPDFRKAVVLMHNEKLKN